MFLSFGIMGMPKRFGVLGVRFFRISGQNKQNLSTADTSLKRTKFFVPWVSALGRFHCIFISIQKILDDLTNAILRLLDKYLGPGLVFGVRFSLRSGWPQKAVLLLLGGYIFSGTLPGSEYSLELYSTRRILEDYWFTKIKLSSGCPRKASFFIIRTGNLQRNSFSFRTVIYQLFRWIFRTRSGSGKVTFVWYCLLFCVESLSWVPLNVSTYSSIKDLLWSAFGCTRKYVLFLKIYLIILFKFYRRPKDGNFDKLALW